MAQINNGHFGSFQGKIGAVTGRKRKGKYYIAQSITRNNSSTEAQVLARLRFKNCTTVVSHFADAVRQGFKHDTKPGETALNAAVGFNMEKLDSVSNLLLPQHVVLSRGRLAGISGTVGCQTAGKISLSWTNDPNMGANDNDEIYLVAYNPTAAQSRMAKASRGAETLQLAFPTSWENQTVHLYTYPVSPDGGKNGDSQYLGQLSCSLGASATRPDPGAVVTPSTTQYTLSVSANNSSYGSVSGGGTYTAGSQATVTATAQSGYRFSQWNDGVSTNPRVVTVNGNMSLTANFVTDGGGAQGGDVIGG